MKNKKKKFLFPLTKSDFISAGAFTEPEHGNDITVLSKDASKNGRIVM